MSQKAEIGQHLRRYGSITPLDALRDYGVMRLAARINELRMNGMLIETHKVTRQGKTFAMYVLEEPNAPDPVTD